MRQARLLGFGTAMLVAGALMFSFTPVDASAHKIQVCHNSPDGDDGYLSVVIEVGSQNSADKHALNHDDIIEPFGLTTGDEFQVADCNLFLLPI